jgi:polar amino acid transport system substrate-binding protein
MFRMKLMQHFSWLIASLITCTLLLSACTTTSGSPQTPAGTIATSARKILVATDGTFPPFENYDGNKQELTGFDIDLINAIAAKSGLNIEFVNTDYKQVLAGVAQCKFDVGISAISMSDELLRYMRFSEPYLTTGQVIVVKKGNLTISDRSQLAGMSVGASAGSHGAEEFSKSPEVLLKTYDSLSLAFQDLITGFIDAVIADGPHAQKYVNVKANNLKIVGDQFASENYAIAICNRKADLVDKINAGLSAVKSDGTLDRLVKKWKVNTAISTNK